MNSRNEKPLLSVCIPTHNRYLWLRSSLWNWLAQLKEFSDEVELIVSDNASTDKTAEVIAEAREWGGFRYNRNAHDVGFIKNFAMLSEMASGDYIWIVGDDDLPRPGTLRRVFNAISDGGSPDYIYVNYTHTSQSAAPKEIIEAGGFDLLPTGNPDLSDFRIKKAMEIVREDYNCFTNIYASIFRSPIAKEIFCNTRPLSEELFSSLESAAPHARYILDNLIGKDIFYIGYPCIVASYSAGWHGNYGIIWVLHWHPLLWAMAVKNGVPRSYVAPHIKKHLTGLVDPLYLFLINRDIKMRNKFSMLSFAKQFWLFPEFYALLMKVSKKIILYRVHIIYIKLLKLYGEMKKSFRK